MSVITISTRPDCSKLDGIEDIAASECIGDSLSKINGNFDKIQTAFSDNCGVLKSTVDAVTGYTPADQKLPIGSIIIWHGTIVDPGGTPIDLGSDPTSLTSGTQAYIQVGGSIDTDWGVCTGYTYGSVATPNLLGRVPIGAGYVTDTTYFPSAPKTFDDNTTVGADEITLVASDLPAHSHNVLAGAVQFGTSNPITSLDGKVFITGAGGGTTAYWQPYAVPDPAVDQVIDNYVNRASSDLFSTENTGGGNRHSNLQPSYGVYFIMRIV